MSWAAISWTAALFVVALPPAPRVSPAFSAAVHTVGTLVCHRRPERSFHINGHQFPVCARCTGLYVSGALGVLLAWSGLPRMPRHPRVVLVAAAVPTAATLVLEWAGWSAPSNLTRALGALPLGAAAGWLVVRMLRAEGRPSTCAMIA